MSLSGCSLAIDAGREQCVSDRDCARLGPAFEGSACLDSLCRPRPDPAWACLDEAVAVASLNTPQQIRFTARLVDIVFQTPVPNIELRVCERLDAECHMPIASSVSDQAGEVVLTLAGGFNGYLRWQSPDTQPVLFFFDAPFIEDSVVTLGVVTARIMEGFDAQFEGQIVEDRAVVVVYTQNCSGAPAAGVRVAALEGDASTRAFYEADGLFPPAQAETTGTGVARIINVPTGNISITGTLSDGREMGISRVLTRTGFATLTVLSPQPR